ncbi:MAG: hypothetical protein LBO08_01635 [Rickettsiales bacterium]|jgi:hypothetical protein|nr:hypothetical protein [Rickettsiales bacterium]
MRIWTEDLVWKKILMELGFAVADARADADVNFDEIGGGPKTLTELRSGIIKIRDAARTAVLGDARLSGLQEKLAMRIAVMPSSREELAAFAKTDLHSVDNAIYELRKKLSVELTNGQYRMINADGIVDKRT